MHMVKTWAFKQPGRKKYKLLFHKGSFKKKVLKYGTPKPRNIPEVKAWISPI